MKITNKINNESYNQWIEQFILDVLTSAHINCNEVVIADIEPSTRIYLTVDNEDYTIRTWSYTPIDKDKYNQPCSEAVEYTLFKDISDGDGGCEEIHNGSIKITWKNEEPTLEQVSAALERIGLYVKQLVGKEERYVIADKDSIMQSIDPDGMDFTELVRYAMTELQENNK